MKEILKKIGEKHGRNAFWAWIAYQAVKGTTTTVLIWLPLIYGWLHFTQNTPHQ